MAKIILQDTSFVVCLVFVLFLLQTCEQIMNVCLALVCYVSHYIMSFVAMSDHLS